MLTQIREHATGWIAWVIVVLITIPFALWGIQSYFEGTSEIPVASVNGEEIPLYAFQDELSRQRQAQASSGLSAPPESAAMRSQVVESMIIGRLLNQYVRDHNYRLSDEDLKQRIATTESFLREGKFDSALYRNLLRANGFTPQSYEARERQNAATAQLSASLTDSSFATDQEMNRLLALQAQTRKTDYLILPAERLAEQIEIEDAEAEQQYQENLSTYQTPARIKVDYIELSVANLAEEIALSEEEISATYEQSSERYKQAEVRKASHILFSVEAAADEQARVEILARAQTVLAEARGGADFAELAKIHSDDPGSKENGGDLGVVTRGQMVQPFEEAVFDMTEDEIRGPIETRFGYHLIKLTELTEARQKLLEESREEVAAEARRIQAESQFAELGEAFQNLVFEDAESLFTAAEELNLEIKQTDWFTANSGDGVASEAKVRAAAFSEDVLAEDLNSATIQLGFTRMVAVRKAFYEDARPMPFEEVRNDIKQRLASAQSRRQTKELGDQLVADLVAGETDWKKLSAQQKVETLNLAEQRDQVPANLAELGDSVFSDLAPESGSATYNGVSLSNGDYAIYAIHEVTRGNVEEIDQSLRSDLQAQLLMRDGNGLYRRLLSTIRQKAEVTINQAQIDNPPSAYR